MAREIRDTLRTRVHLRELAGRTNQAEVIEADTEQHESNLAVKLDPGDHRILGFGLGLAIVVALVILDAVPLNWAAQAFGLNSSRDLARHVHPGGRVDRGDAGLRDHPRPPEATRRARRRWLPWGTSRCWGSAPSS